MLEACNDTRIYHDQFVADDWRNFLTKVENHHSAYYIIKPKITIISLRLYGLNWRNK